MSKSFIAELGSSFCCSAVLLAKNQREEKDIILENLAKWKLILESWAIAEAQNLISVEKLESEKLEDMLNDLSKCVKGYPYA